MYAFTSASNNNGTAFAGIGVGTTFYNTALGLAMLVGRFLPIVFVLALAGSLARQRRTPVTAGTLPTHKPLFVTLYVATIVIVAGLTFFPALALGPIAEALRAPSTSCHGEHGDHHDACRATRGVAFPGRVGAGLFDPRQLLASLPDALVKLDPRHMAKSPVMFVVEVGAVLARFLPSPTRVRSRGGSSHGCAHGDLRQPGRGGCRGSRPSPGSDAAGDQEKTPARLLVNGTENVVPSASLKLGDVVVVEAGEVIPGDGDVIEVASVDESRSPASPRRSSASPAATGRRYWRDQSALGPDRRPDDRKAGRELCRPDDRLVEGAGAKTPANPLNILLAS